jgi:hypothetical protein
MPTWTTSSPPIRAGAYFNFVAAAQVAVQTGIAGVVAVVGTAGWGPVATPTSVGSQGEFETNFSSSTSGSLRAASLAALDGFDLGGATSVLACRVAGSSAAVGTTTLNDGSAAPAIPITSRYKGSRANNFTFTVQTNATDATKKDLLVYENGVLLETYSSLTNTNDGIVSTINATNSPYIVAAVSGTSGRQLANVAAATMTGGDSGLTIALADVSAMLTTLGQYDWNVAVLGGIDDVGATNQSIQSAFATFIKSQNTDTNRRCFGVLGGAAGETIFSGSAYPTTVSAQGRALFLDNENLITLSTDLRRLSDSAILASVDLAPRFAGALAGIGLKRGMTYVKWTGYQVNNPLTNSQIPTAITAGVNVFANHDVGSVHLESGVTTLLTTNTTDRPSSHQRIRNVAIDHFVQRQIDVQMKDKYIGQLGNTEQGRRDLVSAVLGFLRVLETNNVLQVGQSSVDLDLRFNQDGTTNAVFLQWAYAYVNAIERIFSTIRVK